MTLAPSCARLAMLRGIMQSRSSCMLDRSKEIWRSRRNRLRSRISSKYRQLSNRKICRYRQRIDQMLISKCSWNRKNPTKRLAVQVITSWTTRTKEEHGVRWKIIKAAKKIPRAANFDELNEYGHRKRCVGHPSLSRNASFMCDPNSSVMAAVSTNLKTKNLHVFLVSVPFEQRIWSWWWTANITAGIPAIIRSKHPGERIQTYAYPCCMYATVIRASATSEVMDIAPQFPTKLCLASSNW